MVSWRGLVGWGVAECHTQSQPRNKFGIGIFDAMCDHATYIIIQYRFLIDPDADVNEAHNIDGESMNMCENGRHKKICVR
jgi:hypothetical protein